MFHCPFCHGWEVRDRPLVVYGDGAVAERQAALLRGWSSDVTVVDPDEVAALRVEDRTVKAVVRHDGSEVACEGVLVHAPLWQRGRLSERLGLALTEDGLVAVDALAGTSVPGVYAAGDVAVAPQQVAVALGSGHLAGVAATRELLLGRMDTHQAEGAITIAMRDKRERGTHNRISQLRSLPRKRPPSLCRTCGNDRGASPALIR